FEYEYVSGIGFGGDNLIVAPHADCIPPVWQVTNVTVSASPNGPYGIATYTQSVTDNVDPQPWVNCPPSGSSFPLGTSTVTCTARDASGNTSTGTFTVTVVDTTPPVITVPAPIDVPA